MKWVFGIAVLAILLFVACTAGACATTEDEAKSTLEKAGYSNITIGGVAWFGGCGEDDNKRGRKFSATAANGTKAEGTVCCSFNPLGLGKGCTVRF